MFDRDFHVKLVDFGTAIAPGPPPAPLIESQFPAVYFSFEHPSNEVSFGWMWFPPWSEGCEGRRVGGRASAGGVRREGGGSGPVSDEEPKPLAGVPSPQHFRPPGTWDSPANEG